MSIVLLPKQKHRPYNKPLVSVAGRSEVSIKDSNDYYAKQITSGSNDGRRYKRAKTGPKTYDRTKHVLWIYPSGKRRMVHL